MNDRPSNPWDEFCRHCASLPTGPVADVAAVERLLAACWDDLVGNDGGMAGYKLMKRMEAVAWNPQVGVGQVRPQAHVVLS